MTFAASRHFTQILCLFPSLECVCMFKCGAYGTAQTYILPSRVGALLTGTEGLRFKTAVHGVFQKFSLFTQQRVGTRLLSELRRMAPHLSNALPVQVGSSTAISPCTRPLAKDYLYLLIALKRRPMYRQVGQVETVYYFSGLYSSQKS